MRAKTRKWTKEEIQFLKRQNDKLDMKTLMAKMNRSFGSIMGMCNRLKLDRGIFNRTTGLEAVKDIMDISSKEVAYILGFIWGDGSIGHYSGSKYRISCLIVKEDHDNIENLFVKTCKLWRFYERHPQNRKVTIHSQIYSRYLYSFLKDCGYEEKSGGSPAKILSLIPNKLKRYWWLGYSDADGCFGHYPKTHSRLFQISSTFDQDWTETEKLFCKLGCDYRIERYKTDHGNSSKIVLRSRESVGNIGRYLYPNGFEFGLKRKYDKFILATS